MSYSELRKGRYSEPGREYLITVVTHERCRYFENLKAARALIAVMRALESEGVLHWLAWVVMPDHLHGLVSLGETADLSNAMNTLKGRSARAINRLLGRVGAFWQEGFHDHALRREEDRLHIARYIVANPLHAGLVEHVGDYPHWDSVWLS
ncbi:MAG: transposase [Hydrogenophilales bacterium]|nr:transposase [Hydrogenophilales bacterium]